MTSSETEEFMIVLGAYCVAVFLTIAMAVGLWQIFKVWG